MTKHTRAVYDIAPVLPGHCLVMPIRHVLDIRQLNGTETLDMFEVIKKIAPVLLRLYNASDESYSLTAQIGPYSGMSIRHLHLHFIPRNKDDIFQSSGSDIYYQIERSKKISKEEMQRNVQLLRSELEWSEDKGN